MTIVEYCCAGARWLGGRHSGECERDAACDCGAADSGVLHRAVCATVATGQSHAMVDADGDIWYPDDADDARAFFENYDAIPVDRERFPFRELLPLFPTVRPVP